MGRRKMDVLQAETSNSVTIWIDKARTILYVEDDPVVQMAYRHRLEREGFSVESAKDGLEAMKSLLRLEPDLVVLDLMLPKFDGAGSAQIHAGQSPPQNRSGHHSVNQLHH